MRKRKRAVRSRAEPASEQQLAGLRAHAQARKQHTLQRLERAITSLTAQHKPVSARTIYEECGLAYAALRRNPEALLLYRQHSTFLKEKRKRVKAPEPAAASPRDPLLAYKKTDLVARIRVSEHRLQAQEKQQEALLQECVQHEIKIAELEAELARHRHYLEGLRLTIQRQEHQGP